MRKCRHKRLLSSLFKKNKRERGVVYNETQVKNKTEKVRTEVRKIAGHESEEVKQRSSTKINSLVTDVRRVRSI